MPKLNAILDTLKVERLGPTSSWVISWSANDGNRYHINLPAGDKGRLATATEVEAQGCTMYKNPPHSITEGRSYFEYRSAPGFFEPRLLTPTAKANRAMVNQVLHHAIAQDLYGQVIEAERQAREQAEAERREAARQAHIRDQAPVMLKALQGLAEAGRLRCGIDPLNPCWDARPNDMPGQHWGGASACPECTAKAALDCTEGRWVPLAETA